MSLQDMNLETVRRYHEAFNRHDLEGMLACLAEDARNHGRPAGRKGIGLILGDMFETFPDLKFTVEEVVAVEDQVITRAMYSGTHLGVSRAPSNSGQLVGVAPTGRRFSVQHIDWYTLKDGLIVEHRANRDDVGMLVQLGLLPPPPAFSQPS
jgi:predicted ester cyclase